MAKTTVTLERGSTVVVIKSVPSKDWNFNLYQLILQRVSL